jgi:hypothetical protein
MPEVKCKFCAGVKPESSPAQPYSPAWYRKVIMRGGKKKSIKEPGAWRWKDFTIDVLGHRYNVEPPEPPVLNRKWLAWFQRIELHNERNESLNKWVLYNGYHVTHANGWEMSMHYWPSHGLKFTVENFDPARDSQSLEQFLKLLKPEKRGAQTQKIVTDESIKDALSELGDKATQAATAKALNVSETALEQWRRKQGIKTWREVVNRHART